MTPRSLMSAAACAALAAALLVLAAPALAGEGHDHGDAAPAANSNGPKRLPDGSVFLPKPAQRQAASVRDSTSRPGLKASGTSTTRASHFSAAAPARSRVLS